MNHNTQGQEGLLNGDAAEMGGLKRALVYTVRFVLQVLGKLRDDNLHLRSTSLAYTTLLSLVPFLAVTFSVLKGFGVQNQLEPLLIQSLEPLGEKGVDIGGSILSYVNNLNFAVLGFFGIAMLFWTVISLLTKVEESFNAVWHVAGVRSWARRFSDYLSVALVGPVFLFAALGVTTMVFGDAHVQRLASIEPFGMLILGLSQLVPYLLVCAAFAFLYSFLTNYPVRLVPALVGGIFAAVAWYGIGHVFAQLVAGSSKYSAIYSSLAAAVLFIMWVNIGWLIVLVGAYIARYWQHPHLLRLGGSIEGGGRSQNQALALNLMTLIGRAYYLDEPKWTHESLAARGGCGSPEQVEDLVESLQAGGLILATKDEPASFVPARAIESITLAQILAAAPAQGSGWVPLPPVQEIVERIDGAVSDSLEGRTLKDLILADAGPGMQVASDPESAD